MYLMIDTSERDVIALSLFDKEQKKDVRVTASNRELLQTIDSVLTSENILPEAILGIMVVVGEGSFTSTRLATTLANTFGYVRHIPLLAISKKQAEDPQSMIPSLLEQSSDQYLSATYSGVPNLGKNI
ncbi:MAG: hypothetical protein ACD_48C00582G0002 [uncultured bacterium]|nr:MAG: hypothetical protein ACD_48C00582G0002 [uncultured bacterium]